MSTEQISAEAEARRRYNGSGGWDQATDERDTIARAAFVAGAEYALSHHPARVLPSVEDVARVLLMVIQGDVPVDYAWSVQDAEVQDELLAQARAILALFAAAPTVQQVRAEALREVADELEAQEIGQGVVRYIRARAAETEGE